MNATTTIWSMTEAEHGTLREHIVTGPDPGQLLVEIAANGVCASDLATWRCGGDEILGHEPVGRIVAVGPGVEHELGAWVTGRIDRSYATVALADARDIVAVPSGLDPLVAFGEPIGCVVEGYRRTRITAGDRVALVGCGFMGLIMAQLVGSSPVAALVAIDPRPDARQHAEHWGADDSATPDDIDTDESFDVVIEASGSQAGLDLATALVRPHGTLSILGYHQTARSVDMTTWNENALEVVNAHVRDRDLLREATRRGLDLATRRVLDVASLVTHRFAFSDIDDAFRTLATKPPGFVKAVIDIGA